MDLSPYLLFDIARSHYAINAKVVEEVFFLPELTPVAEAPRDIVGMFNLRGTVVPVFDLPHRLGHRRQRYQLSDSLITIDDGEVRATFLVNHVREVVQLDPDSITRKFIYQLQEHESNSPSSPSGDPHSPPLRQRQRFLKGVVQVETHLVSILDEEAILLALRQQLPEEEELTEESREASESEQQERDRFEFCPDASLEEQDVFRQRANSLRIPTETPDLKQILSLAVVALQGEYFGIDLQVVREFTDVRNITPIPCCPPHVVG
ncbi:MAG: chemotaxis protein CheW, partial [Phormidium sp. GEM2.Bin31]